MTRAEFIQRAALTFGADAMKAMEHIKALADLVDKEAPFDPPVSRKRRLYEEKRRLYSTEKGPPF